MRIVVTGAGGMLGGRVVAVAEAREIEVIAFGRDDADITDADAITAAISDAAPDAVINCAAYTDVDGAEADEAVALAVNGTGAGNVAAAAAAAGARIVHVSTDYVFDGVNDHPWVESDPTRPLGAYGRTKLAGEHEVAIATADHAIARTAWLFGAGGKNFCDTMLRLGSERDFVSVVTDQVGCPTWTGHLAPALLDLAAADATGVFHTAAAGQCSWFALTLELFKRAGLECEVRKTTSAEFVRPAARPAWSVLESERPQTPRLPRWQQGVAEHLSETISR
ncbi:MAG TPA: dTDP-4-dehydrorhamnose reductase [Baekduia sp.]|nr:dTDP-4-dehydrorhamnose reductase [Baekduia sp.]